MSLQTRHDQLLENGHVIRSNGLSKKNLSATVPGQRKMGRENKMEG